MLFFATKVNYLINMRSIYIILILTLIPRVLLAGVQDATIESRLRELDHIIDSAGLYQNAKLSRIEQLRYKIELNKDAQQQQVLNSMLYAEYAKYDSRAAFELVSKNLTKSELNGDNKSYALWCTRNAFLHTASGLLKESFDILVSTRPLIEDRTTLIEYYQQMEYLNSHMVQYSTGKDNLSNLYSQGKTNYIDSIAQTIKPQDRYYLVNKGWQHNNSDSTIYYRSLLEERYTASNRDSADDAMDAYTIAHLYNSEGDTDKFTEYLIKAAIADAKLCNHDIASFQELAQIMLEAGDIERSYSYLSYALEKAETFGDRVRVMEIASLMDTTYGELLAKNIAQSKRLSIFLTLLLILCSAVAVLLFYLNRKNNKLKLTLNDLDEANHNLDQHVIKLEQANKQLFAAYDDLKDLNESLIESNFIKESYIGNTFEVCSTHIGKMEKIFTKIANLVRNNKTEELKRYCDSSLLLNVELKVMYQAFDSTFLKMYPNFIERFNELLLPDKQIKLRADETLNTELRIFALNRLGISDNQKIASILHCSLQTIYNNYQKSKNRTELSSKELLNEIMKIN